MIPGTGAVVLGSLAYKCLAVKQRSYFLRCGTETEISLISRRTDSLATSALEAASVPLVVVPFAAA